MSGGSLPRLRTLAARPQERDGRPGVLLVDPLGVAGPHFLPLAVWNVARRLDGHTSAEAAASAAASTTSARPSAADVAAVARELSRRLLLDDARFGEAADRALREFQSAGARAVRAPSDEDPTELRIRLGGLVADDWDMPPLHAPAALLVPSLPLDRVPALHGRAWAAARHARPARLVLVGAAGLPLERPLVPLDRDLATPLGAVPRDPEAFAALAVHPGREVLAHRASAALEPAVLFARLVFRDVPALAVLVGSGAGDPSRSEPLARVLDLPGSTLLVCAATISRSRGAAGAARRTRDAQALEAALRLAPPAFAEAARGEPDAGALVACLEALARGNPAWRGSTLGYQLVASPDGPAGCAAVVWH